MSGSRERLGSKPASPHFNKNEWTASTSKWSMSSQSLELSLKFELNSHRNDLYVWRVYAFLSFFSLLRLFSLWFDRFGNCLVCLKWIFVHIYSCNNVFMLPQPDFHLVKSRKIHKWEPFQRLFFFARLSKLRHSIKTYEKCVERESKSKV